MFFGDLVSSSARAAAVAGVLSGIACSDAAPSVQTTEPRFVFSTIVSDDQGDTTYVGLLPSIELDGAAVGLDSAREFPGNSDLWVRGRSVFVASGDAPSIRRFTIDDRAQLVEEAVVSFASYGVQSAAFWNNTFITDERAYMANGVGEFVVWNPATMQIEGTVPLPALADEGELVARLALADRSSAVVGGKLYQPIYWTDENYADRSDRSVVAVVDVETNQFVQYLDAPCTSLDYATIDEAGDVYFSNWTGSVGTHLVLGTAPNCVVRLDPTTGAMSKAFDFAEITGGHEAAALAYVGAGRFAMSVFHEERVDLAAADDPFVIVAERNWELSSYDALAGGSVPFEGIDWNSGAVYYAQIAGRALPLVPGEDYASTDVYALGDGAQAMKLFETTGWVIRLFELGSL